jgi:hypothetical protein
MIQTVDKIPLSAGFLIEAKKLGSYSERLTIDTTADPTSKKFVFCQNLNFEIFLDRSM